MVSGPGSRSEIEVEGPPDVVPAMLADLVTAHARSHPLTAAAFLATQRTGWRLVAFDGQVLAELTTDDVLVMDGEEVTSQFTELELDARRASPDDLAAVSARLIAAGAVGAAPVPKAIRALGSGASGLRTWCSASSSPRTPRDGRFGPPSPMPCCGS